MKSDVDIRDDIYDYIIRSGLINRVKGALSKTERPDTPGEDIVVSMLANVNGQIQDAYVNVNIYVADVLRGRHYEEDTVRLRTLCRESSKVLEVGRGTNHRFELEEQRVLAVKGRDEHVINNKLKYKQSNE